MAKTSPRAAERSNLYYARLFPPARPLLLDAVKRGLARHEAGLARFLRAAETIVRFLRDERIPGPATIDDAVAHVERICNLLGDRAHVGLGSDMDGGFAGDKMPEGIRAPRDLQLITGQKPIVTRAKRSIAQFRVRTGNPIGVKVTLRGERMWDFLERLTTLALPRIRDFRGVPGKSFDGRGNYSLGMREQLAFPEIDYDKVDRLRGLEISIVTTAKTDEESKKLLELLGMPFAS